MLQVGTTRPWGNLQRGEQNCTRGHTLCKTEEGVSGLRIDPPRHFILIAAPVNWDPPTRELALLVGEESERSCLVSLVIMDLKQFRDRVMTTLPA